MIYGVRWNGLKGGQDMETEVKMVQACKKGGA